MQNDQNTQQYQHETSDNHQTTETNNQSQQNNYYQNNKINLSNKTTVGVLLGLFVGLLGLIIGLLLYPVNTTERQTFMSGWAKGFISSIIIYSDDKIFILSTRKYPSLPDVALNDIL